MTDLLTLDELTHTVLVEVDGLVYALDAKTNSGVVVAGLIDKRYAALISSAALTFNAVYNLGKVLEVLISLAERGGNEALADQLTQAVADIQLIRRAIVEGPNAVFSIKKGT